MNIMNVMKNIVFFQHLHGPTNLGSGILLKIFPILFNILKTFGKKLIDFTGSKYTEERKKIRALIFGNSNKFTTFTFKTTTSVI